MRTKKSVINMFVAVLVQIELVFLGIISRRIFIQNLSVEYLGCNSVFSNILEILSLVGCGASAVSYLTIKAMATEDTDEIRTIFKIVHLYQWITAALLASAGILAGFFLPTFLANSTSFSWSYLQIVYLLFLADLCCSRWAGMGGTPGYYDCVIKASQNQAVCSAVEFIVKNCCLIFQIIVLYTVKNYLLYLTVGVGTKILYTLLTYVYCYKKFPYLRGKIKVTKKQLYETHIFAEIRNSFAVTVAVVIFNGTDNLIITGALGITVTALYSNYELFYNQLRTLINKFLNGMSASIGNYIYQAKSDAEKLELFYRVQYLCGCVACICAVCFFNLVQPFIELLFGKGLLLDLKVIWIQSLMLFITIFFNACAMFRHPAGRYWIDRNEQLLAAFINLVLSLLLVRWMGLKGVLIGTILGTLVSNRGYLKVVCSISIPALQPVDWWKQAALWIGMAMLCLSLTGILLQGFPYSIPFVIVSPANKCQ